MIHANLENYNRYNFQSTLINNLERNRNNGDHIANYELLKEQLETMVTVLKVFGNDEAAKIMINNFVDIIEYHAMNFHTSRDYYKILASYNSYKSSHWAGMHQGIEIAKQMLEIVLSNSPKNCLHGCCK